MGNWEWSAMTWPEIESRMKETRLVIVPVGSVEQHGHHLGVGADWMQAWEMSRRVGEKTGYPVLPILPYGVSGHHKEFPGVITLSFHTYQKVVEEVLDCLAANGVKRVVFINGHGGNNGAITEAAKVARDKHGILCALTTWWDALGERKVLGHPAEQHAGYAETSFTIVSRPDAVRMNKAMLTATKQTDEDIQLVRAGIARFKGGLVRIPLSTIDVSDTGSMTEAHPDDVSGSTDYSKVTPEFAEGLMDDVVAWLCDFIKEFDGFEEPKRERKRP